MKRMMIAVLMLTLVTPAFAKKEPKVYDLVGAISFHSFHSDSDAHVTVGGTTYDSYCNTSDTSVSCSDSGGAFIVTFANGNTTVLVPNALDMEHSVCDHSLTLCDPLMTLLKPGVTSAKFHYRTANFKTVLGPSPFFCVGFTVQDKHGKDKDQERCYEIISVETPDGKTLFGHETHIDQGVKVK